jgi:hypothetical protein
MSRKHTVHYRDGSAPFDVPCTQAETGACPLCPRYGAHCPFGGPGHRIMSCRCGAPLSPGRPTEDDPNVQHEAVTFDNAREVRRGPGDAVSAGLVSPFVRRALAGQLPAKVVQ